ESGQRATEARLEADSSLDEQYLGFLASTLPGGLRGVKIVVDGGNGAASALGPRLLERLGAKVKAIHCAPNGRNINLGCGAMHTESLQAEVVREGADLGVAFDGDADRALFVNHEGTPVDG